MSGASAREMGLVGNRYVLEGIIGRGGMAEVYQAHDRLLRRPVAVKLLRSVAASETERARFTREGRTLARLRHPGLVTILDAATAGDEPYLVMELVRGPNLADCCNGDALEPERVAAIGAQIADALGHAHAAGVVHRDLKPGNVLLGADGRALLTDFGVARLMADTVRHTTTGAAIGTAAYMAPEQVRGQDVTPAADVYALGLVLLEALTGKRAYPGPPVEAALARLTTPPAIPDAVPSQWHELLRAMTALEPTERPSTSAVAAALRGIASGLDPAAATAALRVASVRHSAPMVRRTPCRTTTSAAATRPRSLQSVGRSAWLVGATAATVLATSLGAALVGAALGGDDRGAAPTTVDAPYGLDAPVRSDAAEEAAVQQRQRRTVAQPETPGGAVTSDDRGGRQPAQPQTQERPAVVSTGAEESREVGENRGNANGKKQGKPKAKAADEGRKDRAGKGSRRGRALHSDRRRGGSTSRDRGVAVGRPAWVTTISSSS